jgi:hypothetical protein
VVIFNPHSTASAPEPAEQLRADLERRLPRTPVPDRRSVSTSAMPCRAQAPRRAPIRSGVHRTRSPLVSNGRVDGQARAEDLDLVIGGAELAVQLGELAGVLGVAAFGRGGELGAQPADGLGMLGCGPLLGVGGVAADPVEFGLVLGAPRGQRGVTRNGQTCFSRYFVYICFVEIPTSSASR